MCRNYRVCVVNVTDTDRSSHRTAHAEAPVSHSCVNTRLYSEHQLISGKIGLQTVGFPGMIRRSTPACMPRSKLFIGKLQREVHWQVPADLLIGEDIRRHYQLQTVAQRIAQVHGRSILRHYTLGSSTPVPVSITRYMAHGSCDKDDTPGVAESVSCSACGAADLWQIDPTRSWLLMAVCSALHRRGFQ